MADRISEQDLTAALHAAADGLPLPERLQRPSALVPVTAEQKRRAGRRMTGLSLAAALLITTAGLAVAGPGGLLARRDAAQAETTELIGLSQSAMTDLPALDAPRLTSPMADPIVTDRFGMRQDPAGQVRSLHTGLDFSAPSGTPVLAAADGVVAAVGAYPELGNVVVINHGTVNGEVLSTWYAQVGEVKVKLNQAVSRGDVIALMGVSGGSTGPHLHLEVRVGGRPSDPALWLQR